jgi:hypothetical protein
MRNMKIVGGNMKTVGEYLSDSGSAFLMDLINLMKKHKVRLDGETKDGIRVFYFLGSDFVLTTDQVICEEVLQMDKMDKVIDVLEKIELRRMQRAAKLEKSKVEEKEKEKPRRMIQI